jgi:hypothetical protein
MNDVLQVAWELEKFFRKRGWKFAFIGGIANLAWGEIRTTADVDVSLFTAFGAEMPFVHELIGHFSSRIENAANFALENRVLLLRSIEGIGIDVALAAFDYEQLIIDRRVSVDFGDVRQLTVASAEDLVVMKSFAGRDQDWADVQGIIRRQGRKLDWDYIELHARAMAEIAENPNLVVRLRTLWNELGQ